MLQDWRQQTDAKMPQIKTPESIRKKFPVTAAFKKKFPGNPLRMSTSSCGKKGNPGFREEYNGRENVIASIPKEGSRNFNFTMVKRMDPKKKYKLLLEVGHDKGHSWTLIVVDNSKGNRKRLLTEEISDKTAPDGWKTVEVDLPDGRSSIPLQLTSWYDGKVPVYWSHIDIVEIEPPAAADGASIKASKSIF